MLFKCKICGGTLEIDNNETVATCEYCGIQQTLPKLDDDKRANLYDRANHFRRNNEFDKAMGIYEHILSDDSTDAEAYWSLVLCRYGIEYVEDPTSHKRVPTVNRVQFTSVFDDDNYKSALKYADEYQRHIYEEEAKTINEIQKGFLAISQKEAPFDVFICYKETDNSGKRTPDSVLANELYHQLIQEGFKVFFARITLEDKLGSAYEPYIFAALNSAKVMVVLGTKPEYFNAVWVKNEWSRYLALIKNGAKKMLIPAYKDMDPYDLPDEFSHLQAQDMSKLGFMQDLIRGIKKIVENNTEKLSVHETIISNNATGNVTALLKRGYMALEDGEWAKADDFFEQCLNQDAELAEAYMGKLMAELQVRNQDCLKDQAEPFDNQGNYKKIVRFADDNLKSTLVGYIDHINNRNENARLLDIYSRAKTIMNHHAHTEEDFNKSAQLFDSIDDYEDSVSLANQCREKAEIARKDAILANANAKMSDDEIANYKDALALLKSIPGWRDADEQSIVCQEKIDELIAKDEAERIEQEIAVKRAKREKKIAIISMGSILLALLFIIVLKIVIIPSWKYNEAVELMEAGKYQDAITSFEELGGYKDSKEQIKECEYNYAVDLMNDGKLDDAYSIFKELGDYKDSVEKSAESRLLKNEEIIKNCKVGDYIKFGAYEQDNNTSNGKEDLEWLVLEVDDGKALVISKFALDCKPYNSSYTDVKWETCTLRGWLNDDFLNAAFIDKEKTMISIFTSSDNDTQDKVFLLSVDEANMYFDSDSARECKVTKYAEVRGAHPNFNDSCYWWLRSSGYTKNCVPHVSVYGKIIKDGHSVNYFHNAIRPALWIDMND